jgi:hypothetical protein
VRWLVLVQLGRDPPAYFFAPLQTLIDAGYVPLQCLGGS